MRNSTAWAYITALAASLAVITAGLSSGSAFAQQAAPVTLEQARSGEDGTTDTTAPKEAPLPENADLLAALGVLDIVTTYDPTLLSGLDIPIALLPPAPADAAPAAPSDINTGGQAPSGETTGDATIEEVTTGDSSTIATEPGSGAAPASGATGTAAADGIGATDSGETGRDRPRNHDTGSVDEAPGG